MRNTHESSSGRLAWFLTGAFIGAAAAILYAPRSGKATRTQIADATLTGRDAAAGAGRDAIEAGREMFERGRKAVEDAASLFERGRQLVKG